MVSKKSKFILSSPQILLIMLIILGYLVFNVPTMSSSGPAIRFFDVGQGDASLVTTSSGQNILIDGGPNDVVVDRLDRVLGPGDRRLAAVIISHPHADHISGMIDVLSRYQVDSLYFSGATHTAPEYIELLKIINEKNIPTNIVFAGAKLEVGPQERFEFLYPLENVSGQKFENLNNSSVVVRYVYDKSSVIFLGDLEVDGQEELLNSSQDISANIIKIAHHGSKDSLNKTFLEKVSPRYAVIQVGKDNKFGHPSKDLINALAGIKILRTDYDGDIKFSLQENGLFALDTRL